MSENINNFTLKKRNNRTMFSGLCVHGFIQSFNKQSLSAYPARNFTRPRVYKDNQQCSCLRNEQSESAVISSMIEVSTGAKEAPKRNECVLFCTFLDLINVLDFFSQLPLWLPNNNVLGKQLFKKILNFYLHLQ